ncbi:MAG: hypothetical protein DAHOPDDO_01868 [Ignavibacteriaceae bacterium]|jgi:hypothetical protein|nr:hypothetical protein [Ignavibacteriaceae bacterium]
MKIKYLLYILIFSSTSFSQGFFEKDWETIIDTTWGPGLPSSEKLEIFDSIWTVIDHKYACFQNLDLDWNAVRDLYRPEIESGVSRGRFAAILNYMCLKLNEAHTWFTDVEVNVATPLIPGTPLIRAGGWGGDNHFVAGLIPLPDSTLLVYSAPQNHPIGLEPGDIILGYDGYPWKFLYKELLTREFPIQYQSRCGSNDEAFTHIWLSGAGMNWHLFDTIDVKKYSGEVVHLPTSLLNVTQNYFNYTEQLPVPGVPMDTAHYQMSWGIVEGTNVGYIYNYRWIANDISVRFYNALDSLINVYNVDGLIIDLRVNSGGYFERTNAGMNLLFENDVPDLGLARRDDPYNHYSMITSNIYNLNPDTNTSFNKPIAVLSGPFCISAGDFLIKRLLSHPNVKVFGKTSSTAFASSERVQMGPYVFDYAYKNGFSAEDPDQFLTHLELQVDYEVSFTIEDVRNGDDTVVKEALEWIFNSSDIQSEPLSVISEFNLSQNFPNPFNPTTIIRYQLPVSSDISLKVYDILGNEVVTLVAEYKTAGNYEVKFDARTLTSGVYFYKIQAGNYTNTKKMILMK